MYCWSYYPKIDLHGEYAVTAYTVVHNFISDHIKLKDSYEQDILNSLFSKEI